MYSTSHVDSKIATLNSYLMLIKIYRDSLRVQRDVREVFHLFPNLLPYYGSGHRGTLIYLKGTIPIFYSNVTYYIPVVVWLPLQYPIESPMVVLDPTSDMFIVKSHPHVNEQGVVYHPYMTSWNTSSTLGQYIKLLCDSFSLRPPLQQATSSNTSPPPTRQPPPPPPQQDIPPPPYGYSNNNSSNNNNSGSVSGSSSGGGGGNTSPPSYDSSISKKAPLNNNSNNNNNSNPLPPPQTQQQPTIDTKPIAKPLPNIPQVDPKIETLSKCTIKLQELLSKYYDTTGKEIENFLAHNQSLNELKKKYELEKQTIIQQNNHYDNEIQQLKDKIKQLDDWILENEKTDGSEIDVDVILGPKDSLSKQLLKLVSDDSTIEDLLYYLDKALHSNRITLEEYIKNVRSLSRDQFMIKATVKKVQSVIRSSQSPTNSTSSLGPPPPPTNSSNGISKPQLQQLY